MRAALKDLEETWFGSAFEETLAKAPDEVGEVTELAQDVIDLLACLHDVPVTQKTASLTAFRIVELFYGALAMQRSLFCGGYHSAIREMRYYLEAMVHAVLIDKQGTASVESMIRETRATSGRIKSHLQRLVNMHDLRPANARRIESVWEELSAYAHPTWAELAPALQEGDVDHRLVPGYKADMFREAARLFRLTVDCIGYLVLVQFPQVVSKGRTPAFVKTFWWEQDNLTRGEFVSDLE